MISCEILGDTLCRYPSEDGVIIAGISPGMEGISLGKSMGDMGDIPFQTMLVTSLEGNSFLKAINH